MITNGLKDKAVYILVENLLQKTRKSVAEIQGLPKRQDRGRRKVVRIDQQKRTVEKITKAAV